MKVYNEKVSGIGSIMSNLLREYRLERNFDAIKYIEMKCNKINAYFKEYNLNTAVIAISGGIDSALVLGLTKKASLKENSPIKNIIALTLPASENSGVSDQKNSAKRALEVGKQFGIELINIDISTPSNNISREIENHLGFKAGDWAKGQFVPYLRTSMLYYITNLLTQENKKAILLGTTNADEGQYLGYIGKASDGMVDVQPISDLHKREVYLLAKELGVPDSILKVAPKGDMYDERTDEEVFGASYDFVEAYYAFLKLNSKEQENLINKIKENNEFNTFEELSNNLENMHRYNKHKYMGCSPSVHLDLFEMRIKGGWKYYVWGNDDEK